MLSLQVEVNADMQVLYTCAAFPFFIVFFPFLRPPIPRRGLLPAAQAGLYRISYRHS
jgi:hypothetical protein